MQLAHLALKSGDKKSLSPSKKKIYEKLGIEKDLKTFNSICFDGVMKSKGEEGRHH